MKSIDILIVEDEVILSSCLEMQLTSEGYSVCGIFTSGEEAIDFCINHKPDIILMDINLSGELNGIDTVKKIQEVADIPIIYMTAYNEVHIHNQAAITQPIAYLIKPVEIWDLKNVIESLRK